ncbi:MAG: GspH/FimT family pseudopilin [Sphingomonadaceae bacterium]
MMRAAPSPAGERGFTLIELLVVMVIIGLLAIAVVVVMPDPRGSLVSEAERFAARARAVRERAILAGEPMAMLLTAEGYRAERREQGAWVPTGDHAPLGFGWGEGTSAALAAEGARIVFDPTGLVEPAEVALARDEEEVRILVAGDGEIDVAR